MQEYVIKNRNTPVARIVPIAPSTNRPSGFVIARESPFMMDDDVFDSLVVVPDCNHVDLYDDVDKIPFDRMEAFFAASLS